MKNFVWILLIFISIFESTAQRRGGFRSFGSGARNNGWGRVYRNPTPLRNTRFNNAFRSNSRSMFSRPKEKTHILYKKHNKATNKSYYGRTSGYGSKQAILNKREKSHHMNKQGYGKAMIVTSSKDKKSVRGLEDIMIKKNAQRGRSGNKIAGISSRNKNKSSYWESAKKTFRLPKHW